MVPVTFGTISATPRHRVTNATLLSLAIDCTRITPRCPPEAVKQFKAIGIFSEIPLRVRTQSFLGVPLADSVASSTILALHQHGDGKTHHHHWTASGLHTRSTTIRFRTSAYIDSIPLESRVRRTLTSSLFMATGRVVQRGRTLDVPNRSSHLTPPPPPHPPPWHSPNARIRQYAQLRHYGMPERRAVYCARPEHSLDGSTPSCGNALGIWGSSRRGH